MGWFQVILNSYIKYVSGIIILIISISILTKVDAFAYRPLVTEDAAVGCRGDKYIETAWERMEKPGITTDTFFLVYGYTLLHKFELSVEVPYVRSDPDENTIYHGKGDVLLAAKYLFLGEMPESGSHPQDFVAALKAAVKTRSGDEKKYLGSGENEEELSIALSRCFGRVTVHFMAGYTWITHRAAGTKSNYYLYGYAMDLALFDRLSFVCEVTGRKDPRYSGQRQVVDLLAGLLFSPAKSIILDTYFRRILVQGKDFNSFGIGGTFGF